MFVISSKCIQKFKQKKRFFFSHKSVFLVQQRYVVVALMFISLSITMALRISFPIVLTQMVYVPNINQNPESSSNDELICPIKYSVMENNTDSDVSPLISVISWWMF